MKKRIMSLLCALALCLGMTPATALAAGNAPATLYVGETHITGSGYWTTDSNGKLVDGDASNYNVYYDGSGTLTLKDATIQGRGNISEGDPIDYGIYAASTDDQSVALTINLIGSNTVKGYCGIYVGASGGDSTLVIHSSGSDPKASLEAIGSGWNGIGLLSDSGNVFLTINNASVEASTKKSGYYGVSVKSNAGSPTISLAVNGGSLTAQGDSGLSGIRYIFQANATNPSISLTVSNNAWVKAMPGIDTAQSMASKPTPQGDGIVFDGTEGTVYGDVALDENLTINDGETLTIPEGSTLDTNGNLTNDGTIVNRGTMNGNPTGSGTVVSTPAITTESLPDGTAGQPYTATLEATGNNITWSASGLPAGLTLDADTGAITGTPTTDGQFQVAVTATNSVGSIDRTYTLNVKPAIVPVTGLKLSNESLTLQENGSDTLIATVEPADATNQAVTWTSSDTTIATVSEDGTVTAVSAGNATITATAADGSGAAASCEVTVTHGNMVQTPKKDATCTAGGTEGYWTCGICGKHFKDEGGTVPTTPEENEIPATDHNYGEPEWSWSEDGKTCAVTFICKNDATHKETPKVQVTSMVKKPATCTETGMTTYTATVEFGGETYASTKDVADIPATGHSWGEDGHCTACDAVNPDFAPAVTAGANATWQKGSDKGLSFTSNAAYGDFQKVQVDGRDVDASNYTVEEGSTIVTLKASYLETLSVGRHTLGIVSQTGVAETEFTIAAAAQAPTEDTTPEEAPTSVNDTTTEETLAATGDASTPLATPLLVLASALIGAGALVLRRSRS